MPASRMGESGPPEIEPRPKFALSATQLTTGVVASTVSALLGSTLGVAGTLLGAALGAAVYSVAAALYAHSIAATKHKLAHARWQLRMQQQQRVPDDHATTMLDAVATRDAATDEAVPGLAASGPASVDNPDTVTTIDDTATDMVADASVPAVSASEATAVLPAVYRPAGGKPAGNWRGILAGAVGSAFAFALALVLVTGLESAKGQPLSGGTPGGLSVLGGAAASAPDPWQVPDTGTTPAPSSPTITETATETQTSTETVVTTEPATSSVPDNPEKPLDPPAEDSGLPATSEPAVTDTAPTSPADEPESDAPPTPTSGADNPPDSAADEDSAPH